MCCDRCIEAVQDVLSSFHLQVKKITLGEANFTDNGTVSLAKLEEALKKRGFGLLSSEEERIVEKVRTTVIDMVHHSPAARGKKISISQELEEKIRKPYRYIQRVFSERQGISIEKYVIAQRIEKVKQIIGETNSNFSEIAVLLGYRSLAHLSSQFKKISGMSMLQFRKTHCTDRKAIDKL